MIKGAHPKVFISVIHSIVKLPKFHYDKLPEQISPTHKKPVTSVYQSCYRSYKDMNLTGLNNPGKQHALTSLLYRAKANGLTAQQIFYGLGKLKSDTSYKHDYQINGLLVNSNPLKSITVSKLSSTTFGA